MFMAKILSALHDPHYAKSTNDFLRMLDHEVTEVATLDEMLDSMGLTTESLPNEPPKQEFDVYLMDANLSSKDNDTFGKDTYEPAEEILEHIKPYVESGQIKFIPISGNCALVKRAKKEGFDIELKTSKLYGEFAKLPK